MLNYKIMNAPLVSVIMPCYNMGEYIGEAIDSVINQYYLNFELIIINDGSDDPFTKDLLCKISLEKIKVIHISRTGLSSARNHGISHSSGKYILPLDADDKISKTYITDAVNILENKSDVGIVYGTSFFFGEKEGKQQLDVFDYNKMLFSNQIYCSAFFRRSDFDKISGYDIHMKYGWEDWEFWLSILELGVSVDFIDKPCFFYRIRSNSMVRSMTDEQMIYLRRRIYERHSNLYSHLFSDPLSLFHDLQYYKTEFDSYFIYKLFRKIRFVFRKL